MTEEQTTTIRLVYLGVFRGTKIKRVHCWYPIDADTPLEKNLPLPPQAYRSITVMTFAKLGRKSGKPGSVWEHKQVGNQITNTRSGTYIGFWPHADQVTTWQLRHRALENAIREEGKKTAEMRQNAVFEALSPIRSLYKQSSPQIRTQMLAYIIEYITRR